MFLVSKNMKINISKITVWPDTYRPAEYDLINDRARQFIHNMTENELVDFSLELSGKGPMSSSFGNTDFISMTFKKLSWIRMPAPYQTNCLEYQDILQVSDATQYDCFDICIKTRVSDVIGYLPIHSTLSRFKTNMSIPIFDPEKRNSSKELHLYQKIKENCFRRCSRDACKRTAILPHPIKYVGAHETIMVEFAIQVYQPEEPDMQFNYIASIDLIDFLVYVGNTIAFWFGVSVIDLLLLRQSFAARATQLWKFASKDQHEEKTEHTVSKNHFIGQFRKLDLLITQIETCIKIRRQTEE